MGKKNNDICLSPFLLKNDSIANIEGFLAKRKFQAVSCHHTKKSLRWIYLRGYSFSLMLSVVWKLVPRPKKSLLDLKVKSSLLLIAVLTAMIQIGERRNNWTKAKRSLVTIVCPKHKRWLHTCLQNSCLIFYMYNSKNAATFQKLLMGRTHPLNPKVKIQSFSKSENKIWNKHSVGCVVSQMLI